MIHTSMMPFVNAILIHQNHESAYQRPPTHLVQVVELW